MSAVHDLVKIAVEVGYLMCPTCCCVCQKDTILIAHHDDYAHPFDVRWMCRQCHGTWHKINGPGLNHNLSGLKPIRPVYRRTQFSREPLIGLVNAERSRIMAELVASGRTLASVGAEFGISRERVRQLVGSPARVRCVQKQIIKENKDVIAKLREEGKMLREIALTLGVSVALLSKSPKRPVDIEHGTAGGYNYWGCRCELCRRASTERCRKRVLAMREQGRCIRCGAKHTSTFSLCLECRNEDKIKRQSKGVSKTAKTAAHVGRSGQEECVPNYEDQT